MCGDASSLLSLLLLFVYFLALPSLLTFSIYLLAFYTCSCALFSTKATESEGCDLVHSLGHEAMLRHGQGSMSTQERADPSLLTVLHSFLHKDELSATTNSSFEYEIPASLVSQTPIITM